MKSARLFLAGIYVYPCLYILIPLLLVILINVPAEEAEAIVAGFIGIFFCGVIFMMTICLILVFGGICMGMAEKACIQGEYEKLRRGWLLLKYAAIPFYIVNFIYIRYIWSDFNYFFMNIRNIRDVFVILFLLIPVIFSCMMVFQSGFVGWCYMKYLKKQPEIAGTKMAVHYFMQAVMMLDVISTILLCHKEKKNVPRFE